MQCPDCGQKINDYEKRCSNCGYKLVEENMGDVVENTEVVRGSRDVSRHNDEATNTNYIVNRVTNKAEKEALTPEERKAQKRRNKNIMERRKAENKRKKALIKGKFQKMKAEEFPAPLIWREDHCAQDALGYELLFEDGTIKIKDEAYSRVIEFEDASFQAAREAEQNEIYERWTELLSSYDNTAHLQVKVICRVIDKELFQEQTYLQPEEGDVTGNKFRKEINKILEGKIEETQQNVKRTRLLVITVQAPTKAKAIPLLARETEKAIRQFKIMGVDTKELRGNDLLALINTITNPDDPRDMVSFNDLYATSNTESSKSAYQLGYSTKDLIAPANFARPDDRHVSWNEQWGQSLYVQKWANSVRTDIISELAEIPINQIITLDMNAWEHTKAMETVESMVTDLKVQKTDYILKHSQTMYITDEMLPTNLQDAIENANETRTDLVSRDQQMWSLTFTTFTWANSQEACDENAEHIKDVFRRFLYRVEPLIELQGQGFAAALPTGNCDLPYVRNLTTAPLAALIPFTSVELMEDGGMFMGQNSTSKNFIFYNRKDAIAPNGFILGKPGRGKSVTAKNTILHTLLTDSDAEVIVLDPEREYVNLVKELGGELVEISGKSKTYINPFDIALEDDENPLAMKTDAIISMVEMMSKNLTELQKSLVDRSVSRVYDKYFETKDPKDLPTLTEFYETLKNQPEKEAGVLATTIERYVNGQAAIFNHHTNVNTQNRFVVYDIRDCADNMKGLALLILLDATWQRIVANREKGTRTWLFVDEMQLLFENEYAITYFDQLWTRSRKYGAIPTGITQNVERLVNNEKTRLMLANSDFMVLLGQSASDAEALGDIIRLSDRQIATIRNAGAGEGLLVAAGKIVPFINLIPTDTAIYRMITTKLDDITAYKQQKSTPKTQKRASGKKNTQKRDLISDRK